MKDEKKPAWVHFWYGYDKNVEQDNERVSHFQFFPNRPTDKFLDDQAVDLVPDWMRDLRHCYGWDEITLTDEIKAIIIRGIESNLRSYRNNIQWKEAELRIMNDDAMFSNSVLFTVMQQEGPLSYEKKEPTEVWIRFWTKVYGQLDTIDLAYQAFQGLPPKEDLDKLALGLVPPIEGRKERYESWGWEVCTGNIRDIRKMVREKIQAKREVQKKAADNENQRLFELMGKVMGGDVEDGTFFKV